LARRSVLLLVIAMAGILALAPSPELAQGTSGSEFKVYRPGAVQGALSYWRDYENGVSYQWGEWGDMPVPAYGGDPDAKVEVSV
jgi:hypothetical protein